MKNKIKKIALLLLAIITVFGLTACGKEETKVQEDDNQTNVEINDSNENNENEDVKTDEESNAKNEVVEDDWTKLNKIRDEMKLDLVYYTTTTDAETVDLNRFEDSLGSGDIKNYIYTVVATIPKDITDDYSFSVTNTNGICRASYVVKGVVNDYVVTTGLTINDFKEYEQEFVVTKKYTDKKVAVEIPNEVTEIPEEISKDLVYFGDNAYYLSRSAMRSTRSDNKGTGHSYEVFINPFATNKALNYKKYTNSFSLKIPDEYKDKYSILGTEFKRSDISRSEDCIREKFVAYIYVVCPEGAVEETDFGESAGLEMRKAYNAFEVLINGENYGAKDIFIIE